MCLAKCCSIYSIIEFRLFPLQLADMRQSLGCVKNRRAWLAHRTLPSQRQACGQRAMLQSGMLAAADLATQPNLPIGITDELAKPVRHWKPRQGRTPARGCAA